MPLDLTLLQHFDAPGIFTRIDPDVEERLESVPEMRERMAACVYFCHRILAGDDRVDAKREDGLTQEQLTGRRKYLRAALGEFASLDAAVAMDLSLTGRQAPKMSEVSDPRVHIVRLLRHANVHLSATSLSHATRNATWEGPAGTNEFKYQLITGVNLEAAIRETQSSQKYSSSGLNGMITWLVAEQGEWGIHHLILRTAEAYGRIVLAAI
jgi:hypothetical protein